MLLSKESMTGTGAGAGSRQETPVHTLNSGTHSFTRRPLPLQIHVLGAIFHASVLSPPGLVADAVGMVASISSLDTAHCRLLSRLVLVHAAYIHVRPVVNPVLVIHILRTRDHRRMCIVQLELSFLIIHLGT
jgi:hypothetical protein